jgi:hypothetical protein
MQGRGRMNDQRAALAQEEIPEESEENEDFFDLLMKSQVGGFFAVGFFVRICLQRFAVGILNGEICSNAEREFFCMENNLIFRKIVKIVKTNIIFLL